MKHTPFFTRLTLVLMLFLAAPFATAESSAEIKNRMKARLPSLEALWQAGTTGENNKGFIEARGSVDAKQKALIEAENADRKSIYTSIARSTGTTPSKVGKQRAAQIASRAASSLWLQTPKGEWYKK